jgi:plastocyanin
MAETVPANNPRLRSKRNRQPRLLQKVKEWDMKQRIICAMTKSICMFAAILFLGMQGVSAATHVVLFGGSVGFAYSPSSFSATVGDTVKWEGDFTVHPLASTSVPATAQTFSNGSGPSFIYVIKVPGTYNFHCTVHLFTGTFTATASAVKYQVLPQVAVHREDLQLGVVEVSGLPFVTVTVGQPGQATVKVFDLSGREMATILNRVVPPGTYSIPLAAATRARGLYFVKLSSKGAQRTASFFMSN